MMARVTQSVRRRTLQSAAVLFIGMCATAPAAVAAERFASPAGVSTGPCSQAAPCDIVTAVNQASAGDDVTIEPGTYGSPTPLSTTLTDGGQALTIHGGAGAERPTIVTNAAQGIDLTGGSSLRDIRLNADAATGVGLVTSGPPSMVDHAFITASGTSVACEPNGTLANSVCWASGSGSSTVVNGGIALISLINDTLDVQDTSFPQGGALAVEGPGNGNPGPTVDVTNTIAHGNPDIAASGGATLNIDHSAYLSASLVPGSPVNNLGGNVPAAPSYVNPTSGDFRELPTSPTVDAGADSPAAGSTDLDGLPRRLGGHTDIGAYEHVPAPACHNVSATTTSGVPVTVTLSCSDALGAPLTFEIVTPGLGGAALEPTAGRVTYTPSTGFVGTDSFTFRASSGHGLSNTATATVTVLPPAPVLTGVQQSHGTWVERARSTRRHKHPPVGTRFAFHLNVDAVVTLAFVEHANGRRVSGRCVPATRRNQHKPRCRRLVAAGAITLSAHAGLTHVAFAGRLGARRLAPGSYSVILTARNAGGRSAPADLTFTIAPA